MSDLNLLDSDVIMDDDDYIDPFALMFEDDGGAGAGASVRAGAGKDATETAKGSKVADALGDSVVFDDEDIDPFDLGSEDAGSYWESDGEEASDLFGDEQSDGEAVFDVSDLFGDDEVSSGSGYMATESGSVLPFKGKFFVGYLGITPLVLYKENIDTLMSIIKTYTNIPMLNKLVFNMEGSEGFSMAEITPLEGFIPHMNKAFNHHLSEQLWNDEERALATEIRQTVLNNWGRIKQYVGLVNLCRASNIEISPVVDNIIKRHVSGSSLGLDSFNIVKILTTSDDPRKAIESVSKRLITAIATESNKGFIDSIISSYQLMTEQKSAAGSTVVASSTKQPGDMLFEEPKGTDSPEMGVDKVALTALQSELGRKYTTLMYLDKDSKLIGSVSQGVGTRDYFSSFYEYSQMEYKILEDLGFPVVIAGNEHQLKRRLANPAHISKEQHAVFNNLTYIGMIATKGELLVQQARYQMPETIIMF